MSQQTTSTPVEQSSAPAPAVAVDNTTPRDTNGNSLTPEDDVARRALLEKLDHLERKNAKLEFDSAQVHAVDRKKTELIEMLQRESDVRKEDVKVVGMLSTSVLCVFFVDDDDDDDDDDEDGLH